MPSLPGYTDPGNVDDGDVIDPIWGDAVRADLNLINSETAKSIKKSIATAQINVANTTTETSILSAYTVPGGTLGTGGVYLDGVIWGRIENSTGSDRTITLKLKYGTTTIATIGPTSVSTGKDLPVKLEFMLMGDGSASAQVGQLIRVTEPLDGLGTSVKAATGTAAEDSTGDLDLDLTATFNLADTTFLFDAYFHVIRLHQN